MPTHLGTGQFCWHGHKSRPMEENAFQRTIGPVGFSCTFVAKSMLFLTQNCKIKQIRVVETQHFWTHGSSTSTLLAKQHRIPSFIWTPMELGRTPLQMLMEKESDKKTLNDWKVIWKWATRWRWRRRSSSDDDASWALARESQINRYMRMCTHEKRLKER